MIYITGDTHGETERFTEIAQIYGLRENDTLVVAGDFGCIFGLGSKDEVKLDRLAECPYTILFLDGNHECFPKIYSYPEEERFGGKVHVIRHNVLHLERGQVFELEGLKVFTMGGGYSIDAMLRVPGRSWWPEEMPNVKEYEEAWKNLKKYDHKVDVIVSHAAPENVMRLFTEIGIFNRRYPEEMKLNMFLEEVRRRTEYKHYYFGHLHMDRPLHENQTALYYAVYDLKTGERAERVNTEQ